MKEKYFDINGKNNIRCKIYCEEPRSIRDLKKIVIFFHGFGGHKDNKAAERFAQTIISKEKKTGVIVFDWPAHGDDIKKHIVLKDCDDYLSAVVEYVVNIMKIEDIYAYGISFGAYMIMKYIYENTNPFKKIALRCPAIPMHEVMRDAILKEEDYYLLNKGKEAQVGFDIKVCINQAFLDDLITHDISKYDYLDYADDILILHGLKDEIVPIEGVRNFCENNVIEFIPVENADHRFCDLNALNWANHTVMEFLKENT